MLNYMDINVLLLESVVNVTGKVHCSKTLMHDVVNDKYLTYLLIICVYMFHHFQSDICSQSFIKLYVHHSTEYISCAETLCTKFFVLCLIAATSYAITNFGANSFAMQIICFIDCFRLFILYNFRSDF